jgi:DNA-binding IclR family transcriptional regulator
MLATKLTTNGVKIMKFLQAHEGSMFGYQIAEAVGIKDRGVHGIMNSLFKRGYVGKTEAVERIVDQRVQYQVQYFLTKEGKSLEV